MNKQEFKKLLSNQFFYLDGATGSNLMQKGMTMGVCPEKWILENEDVLLELQKAYVSAGSQILYAPTFTCNRIKLEEYGLDEHIEDYNRRLVALSKKAADGKAFVAGDITMTGRQLAPLGTLQFEELVTVYQEQIRILVDAGVDLLIVETMMSLQETRAALIAAKEVCDLPVMVTMTFEADGRTLYGTDAVTAAIVCESLGADAFGANCSTGPDGMISLIKSMKDAVSIPIIAKPNAGLPSVDQDGNTVYDMNAKTFAKEMQNLSDVGASVLGGCCGTTPDHIHELTTLLSEKKPLTKETVYRRALTSERKTIVFGLDDPFIIVGERINPTGKKLLQQQLREGNLQLVRQFAEEQEKNGARLLDINMGMSGIDEKEMMLTVIEEVSSLVSLPLVIDSSHVDVIEAALRNYPGRALINSISLESTKLDALLPIAKKYGAMFILLPLSDEGLPKNVEEKLSIIETIVDRAIAIGMKKEDIIVDGLVATVAANKTAALETIETIRYCKENNLATICGLSNISFGLPERGFINSTFLTLAIEAGLTMAIANPSQDLLVNSALATDLLLNKKQADITYIEHQTKKKEGNLSNSEISVNNHAKDTLEKTDLEKLTTMVMKGDKASIEKQTTEALEKGYLPKEILDQALLPAINQVGALFEKGTYFLPQLIASAETMKLSIEILEPLLLDENAGEEMPTVIIATVKGDIHDIGKNLVALMMKNYGFHVIDLGKDVSKEEIVEKAVANNASLIALSALMTTTMKEMKHVIEYAKEKGVTAKVIVGGAVITEDYANEIHADGYSKDAQEAVKISKKILCLE